MAGAFPFDVDLALPVDGTALALLGGTELSVAPARFLPLSGLTAGSLRFLEDDGVGIGMISGSSGLGDEGGSK